MKIICPNTPDDIIHEGNALHHCVGKYISRIANKECLILFLRQCGNETKPFYTVELRHRRIIQVRGQSNHNQTPEVQNFIEHWKQEVLQAPALELAG